MSAEKGIAILDSMFDLFKEMGSGLTLGLQLREIARRLTAIRGEITWTPDVALAANKLRSNAGFYASRFVRRDGDGPDARHNRARLDDVVTAYSELRHHLEQQLGPIP